jgi:hypothetical protein
MKTIAISAVSLMTVAAFLTGCETPLPPGAERGPHGTMAFDVLIEATPPGARIEANGQPIGNAPVHLKIFGDPDGTFHDFGSYYYMVRALPLTTNQYVQTRLFQTGHLLTPEDQIPQRIYFDMNQPAPNYPPPAPPDYWYPPYGPPYYYGPTFDFGPPYYYYRPGIHLYIRPRPHRWHR